MTSMLNVPSPASAATLVLGAGGVRGLAHVGAIKVFERNQVRFDLVVGASIGALVGAAFAMGIGASELERATVDTPLRDLLRFRPHGTGLLCEPTITSYLGRLYGDARIEELPVRFVAATASLRTRSVIGLDRGLVVEAVRAAIAAPFLLSPVALRGDLLADSGLIDGLPVGLARQHGAGRVVAVEADTRAPSLFERWPARHLRGWALRVLEPWLKVEPPTPTRRWILLHQLCAAARRPAFQEEADLTIRPLFGRIMSNDARHRARCVLLGEAAAETHLGDLLRLVGRTTGTPSPSGEASG